MKNTQHIGIIGSGQVGIALANGLKKHGYEVTLGSRDGKKVTSWDGEVGTFTETASRADMVILATKGTAAEEVAGSIADTVAGKVAIDVTNPIKDVPPQNGILQYFTSPDKSLLEIVQDAAPKGKWVKAFNSVGNAHFIDPDFGGIKPTMFICGDDVEAKEAVAKLLAEVGWESEDMGGKEAARAIEPLCVLWCIPGFMRNEWNHAFKLLKK